jgi:hypothetical protein
MAEHFRKPTGNNREPLSFTIQFEGQTYSGTLTPSGKPPAFGMPNAFVVRMQDSAPMNISIYMGKWMMPAKEKLAKTLGEWIEAHYK